jgi:enoyl-CoA hydratase
MTEEVTTEMVQASLTDGVLHVTLCRPPANALGPPLLSGLHQALDSFDSGPAKVMVVDSALPGCFAAGADIAHMSSLTEETFADYRDALRDSIERLAGCERPTIAAIDGRALGGGLELALACSLRFATSASLLGLPEIKLGLVPGAGGTQRLPRLVGRGRALELMLSGRDVTGTEAAEIGLVDRLVDGDATAAAIDYAAALAEMSESALAAIVECVEASELPLERGMAVEGDAILRTFADGEGREGIAAFVEKRPPVFA